MHEIERRFLVNMSIADIRKTNHNQRRLHMRPLDIEQRYLSDTGNAAIRVRKTVLDGRVADPTYHLTMKWKKTARSAIEMEHPIDGAAYGKYETLTGPIALTKRRWRSFFGTFEVDQFLNPELRGLVIAEIELQREDEEFERPAWLGEEVTGRFEYSNLALWQYITGQAPLGFDFRQNDLMWVT